MTTTLNRAMAAGAIVAALAGGAVLAQPATASADVVRTVLCYRNADSGNNGQRIQLNFRDDGAAGVTTTTSAITADLQQWNGRAYANTGTTRSVAPGVGYQAGNPSSLCSSLASSFFLGGPLGEFRIGAFG